MQLHGMLQYPLPLHKLSCVVYDVGLISKTTTFALTNPFLLQNTHNGDWLRSNALKKTRRRRNKGFLLCGNTMLFLSRYNKAYNMTRSIPVSPSVDHQIPYIRRGGLLRGDKRRLFNLSRSGPSLDERAPPLSSMRREKGRLPVTNYLSCPFFTTIVY